MAIDDYQTQLENVQAAIRAVESGCQQYTVGDRTVMYPPLATLYRREQELRRMVERANNGGIRVRGGVADL